MSAVINVKSKDHHLLVLLNLKLKFRKSYYLLDDDFRENFQENLDFLFYFTKVS